jgi:hypothetical protein
MNKVLIFIIVTLLIIIAYYGYSFYEKFQIVECSTLTNCKSCANSFGCLWCVKSNKCVSDLSNNILCSGESTVADPLGCDIALDEKPDFSSPMYGGKCGLNTDCNTCLSSPDCFWCSTKNVCTSTSDVFSKCVNDPSIYNSIEQCILKPKLNNESSIIPVLGLSRNIDGSLTQSSLKIIFDGFAARGDPIVDLNSKNRALSMIDKEVSFYNTLPVNSDVKQHINDLEKVSGYIEGVTIESFVDSSYEYEKEKNKNMNGSLQLIMALNLLAIGSLFYFMRR